MPKLPERGWSTLAQAIGKVGQHAEKKKGNPKGKKKSRAHEPFGSCALFQLRRKVFMLPGSICRENIAAPFSWQEVSLSFSVETCAPLCKSPTARAFVDRLGHGVHLASFVRPSRANLLEAKCQEAGMAFSSRRTSLWYSSESAEGRREPNLAKKCRVSARSISQLSGSTRKSSRSDSGEIFRPSSVSALRVGT